MAVLLWAFGDVWLARWLGIDLSCVEAHGRRAQLARTLICAAADGPRGWLYLAFLIVPVAAVAWWLRRKLRAAHPQDEQTRA